MFHERIEYARGENTTHTTTFKHKPRIFVHLYKNCLKRSAKLHILNIKIVTLQTIDMII